MVAVESELSRGPSHNAPASVPERYLVCGVPITSASMEQVLNRLADARWGHSTTIHFCSTHSVTPALTDSSLRAALCDSTMNLPDGWPVALWGHVLRVPEFAGQIPGPDTFERAIAHPEVAPRRHFLFGGTPHLLELMSANITARFPDANIVGELAPPFGDLEDVLNDDAIRSIADAKPDIVWVGLGSPLQDRVLDAAKHRLPTTLVAVGAAFDFIAGTKARAPRLLRVLKIEWLYRLIQEPGRLWRRYVFGGLRMLMSLVTMRPRRLRT